jgi:hypothetical protein
VAAIAISARKESIASSHTNRQQLASPVLMHKLSAGCVPAESKGMLTHSASPTAKKRALSNSILSSVTALLRSAALSLALIHSQRERWAATEAAPASVQGAAASAAAAAVAAAWQRPDSIQIVHGQQLHCSEPDWFV